MHVRLFTFALLLTGCAGKVVPVTPVLAPYNVKISGGTIYDGSGGAGYVGDVAIDRDKIACVGHCPGPAIRNIDATGLAVTPGFINMLSWSTESLIADGRSQSDIRQGVTLEVMGRGRVHGPVECHDEGQ